jgi:hypothetical protein
MSRQNIDWVVLHSNTHAKCLRCGVEEPLPKLPLSVDDWVKQSNTLCKKHAKCPAPNFTPEGKAWALPLIDGDRATDDKLAKGHAWIRAALDYIMARAEEAHDKASAGVEVPGALTMSKTEALSTAFGKFRHEILGDRP